MWSLARPFGLQCAGRTILQRRKKSPLAKPEGLSVRSRISVARSECSSLCLHLLANFLKVGPLKTRGRASPGRGGPVPGMIRPIRGLTGRMVLTVALPRRVTMVGLLYVPTSLQGGRFVVRCLRDNKDHIVDDSSCDFPSS